MGRPKIFLYCPVCGAKSLCVRGTRKVGHCTNRWCECESCGARVRFVRAGSHGYWLKVKINSPETP